MRLIIALSSYGLHHKVTIELKRTFQELLIDDFLGSYTTINDKNNYTSYDLEEIVFSVSIALKKVENKC